MFETTYQPEGRTYPYLGHGHYISPSPEADQKPAIDGSFAYMDRTRSSLPLDAPVQPRRYLTPSATSRKPVPAHVAKQLQYYPAFSNGVGKSSEDEHDQLTEEGVALDPEIKQQILDKRRRNTLSARKSRLKRTKQMQDLEQERNELLKLVHDYRNYIDRLHETLKQHGVHYNLPSFS